MQTPAGNELQYTFVQDFQTASAFGLKSVRDTFKKVWDEWKGDYKAVAEIAIATNWECWRWYEIAQKSKDPAVITTAGKLSDEYSKMYHKVDMYANTHLKGEEYDYYFQMTD